MSPERARCDVVAIVEDGAHEALVRALVLRLASERRVRANVEFVNVGRGAASYGQRRKRFLRRLEQSGPVPDVVVVLRDGNGDGWSSVRDEQRAAAERLAPGIAPVLVVGCPDPYVERWCLLDARALRDVFGTALVVDQQSRDVEYFKRLLDEHAAQVDGGLHLGASAWIRDIVERMDLHVAGRASRSFADFVSELRGQFRRIERS